MDPNPENCPIQKGMGDFWLNPHPPRTRGSGLQAFLCIEGIEMDTDTRHATRVRIWGLRSIPLVMSNQALNGPVFLGQ